MEFDKPDWNFWLLLSEVEAAEAVLLSFNVCPTDVDSRMGFFSEEERNFFKEANKRSRLLAKNLKNQKFFPSFEESADLKRSKIELAEFANWAVHGMKLADLPPELVKLSETFVKEEKVSPPENSADAKQPSRLLKLKHHETEADDCNPSIENRIDVDIQRERGTRRRILENWEQISLLHGPSPDGWEVFRFLNKEPDEKKVTLKTVQNRLIELRNEKLIP